MKYFYKIAFETNKALVEEAFNSRIKAASVIKLPLYIKPIDQTQAFQLYFIPTNEMVLNCCAIYSNHARMTRMVEALPGIAKKQFLFDSIIAEMQNTNEIEGVSSTRAELVESAKALNEPEKRQRKFRGLIDTYFKLFESNDIKISNVEDIRAIYDELVANEIQPDEKPDGQIFRKENTYIKKRTGTDKIIHMGIYPESEIIQHLKALFDFMDNDDIANLIKIAIHHYYFGYIHPFYDGNGRTARFISNYLIKKELGIYSAISLSRSCNMNSKKYAEMFEFTTHVRNRGELNLFIEGFLSLLREGQKDVILDLEAKYLRLLEIKEKIDKQTVLINEKNRLKDILNVMAEYFLFSEDGKLTLKEIQDLDDEHKFGSALSIRKALSVLEECGLLDIFGKKPRQYRISQTLIK